MAQNVADGGRHPGARLLAQSHLPDPAELDRCTCGAKIIYFEGPARGGRPGWGCEALGRPTMAFEGWTED